jgi:hypothetical protein
VTQATKNLVQGNPVLQDRAKGAFSLLLSLEQAKKVRHIYFYNKYYKQQGMKKDLLFQPFFNRHCMRFKVLRSGKGDDIFSTVFKSIFSE